MIEERTMKFNKEEIIRLWSEGLTLRVNYTDYKIGKTSYGQYFLELEGLTLRETDNHDINTLWLIPNKDNKNILEVE